MFFSVFNMEKHFFQFPATMYRKKTHSAVNTDRHCQSLFNCFFKVKTADLEITLKNYNFLLEPNEHKNKTVLKSTSREI